MPLTPLKPKIIYTSDFILHAKSIQKQRRYNYENLQKELERTYPNLKFESFKTFADELKLGFSLLKIHNCFVNTQSPCCNYLSEAHNATTKKMTKNSLLVKSVPCGNCKHEGRWAECEKRQLIYVLKEGAYTNSIFNQNQKIDWLTVASKITGRSLRSCSDKYH